jgi:hypothetical protein
VLALLRPHHTKTYSTRAGNGTLALFLFSQGSLAAVLRSGSNRVLPRPMEGRMGVCWTYMDLASSAFPFVQEVDGTWFCFHGSEVLPRLLFQQ